VREKSIVRITVGVQKLGGGKCGEPRLMKKSQRGFRELTRVEKDIAKSGKGKKEKKGGKKDKDP